MTNLIQKSKSTNIDYFSFRVSLLFFEAALFYHFCLLDFDFSYVEVSQHFGNSICLCPVLGVTFHEEIYRINSFAQNIFELLIFSAMNLLKPATLLFFWKSVEWTQFFQCMTLAQRTRKDVKHFKVKLHIFICNYLEYYFVSWESWLEGFICKYFHLSPLFSFTPAAEIYWIFW